MDDRNGIRRSSKEGGRTPGCPGLSAVSNLEVRCQSGRDRRAVIFELEITEKKHPVEKAKGSAKKYTET